jgi:hypothetical protein
MMNKMGRGCLMYKTDLRRAYRQIPVDPGEYPFLCYTWRGNIYADTVLPFGLRSAAMSCQRTTRALSFIHNTLGYTSDVYLDDFIGADIEANAWKAFDALQTVIKKAGFVEAISKAESPTTRITFLGVQFDSETMTMEVTNERIYEIESLLETWICKKKCRKRELQSLIGKLQFVAKCVPPGRLFISRMLALLKSFKKSHHYVSLNTEFRKDIGWWCSFVKHYNGVSVVPETYWSNVDAILSSDASLRACGAIYENQCFHRTFPEEILDKDPHINVLELLTISVACKIWGQHWKGKKIVIYCDNEASVIVLNTGRCKCSRMLQILRELFQTAAQYEFSIRAVHRKGTENRISDCLSRWHEGQKYRTLFTNLTNNRPIEHLPISNELFRCNTTL